MGRNATRCDPHTAGRAYDWAIANGIAKEQAPLFLPKDLPKTRLYMNGTPTQLIPLHRITWC